MPERTRPKIILIGNSAWNLWNFRRAFIEMLLANNFQVVCLAPDDPYSGKLRHLEGVTFIPLRRLSRKSLSPLGNFFTFLEITRLLRREKPALALFYTIKPNIFGGLASWISGTTAIANIEGMGYAATAPGFFRRLVFVLYRFAFRFVKKVVFLNDDDRAVFLKHHVVAPDKTQVIKGTGIDVHHFSPSESHSQEPVFLFIGRLLSDKGIREFETAAVQVKAAFPDARFQMLGNIDPGNPASIQAEELRQWIEKQCIEHLGQSDDVRPFIASAAAVVLPSYREGIPRVLLEGMALGKPIITTDAVGCKETIEHEKNGFMIPAKDAGALAAAMIRFLELPREQHLLMGQYGRQKVQNEFSNEVILPQYLLLIRQVLGGPAN